MPLDLRDYARVDACGSDFEGDGFEGGQHSIYWCKATFDCQKTAIQRTEILHVSAI